MVYFSGIEFPWRNLMGNLAIENPGRRRFLQAAPLAAAAGIALADASLFTSSASAQDAAGGGPSFQVFSAAAIQDDIKALDASPGNNNLVDDKTFIAMLTVEKAKSAKEFEWHEGRDHVFYILDGSTVYELGGTPKNGHSTKPGEWLAPESEGATKVTLNTGDVVVVRRGTPHRRTTAESVTLILISPQGTVSA
jgi:mannose-6-phosphate isomerase-like protein (cupin superfamily)